MRSNPWLVVCSLVAGSVGACGCGGGSIDLEHFADEAERAQCESNVRCGVSPDMETCLATSFPEREDNFNSLINAVNAGTIEYHGDLARECIDVVSEQGCTTWASIDAYYDFLDVCMPVFEGKVVEGGTCVIRDECVGDGPCLTDPGCMMACCVGTCGPPARTPAPIGADCSSTECVEGAWCSLDAGVVCTALIASGGTCDDVLSCARPNLCDIDFATGMGTCRPPPDSGEACSVDGLRCEQEQDYCDAQTLVCTRRGDSGAPCSEDEECMDYAKCNGTSCVTRPAEGESCPDIVGPNCLGDLECTGGTCQPPPDVPGCTIGG